MRPVYGITVLRYPDGTQVVREACHPATGDPVPMPASWEMRHKMLIDALAEVKREAGVTHEPERLDGARAGGFISKEAAIELLNAECSSVTPAQRLAFVEALFNGPPEAEREEGE